MKGGLHVISHIALMLSAAVLQKIHPVRTWILAFLLADGSDGDVGARWNPWHRPRVARTELRIDKSIFLPMRPAKRTNGNAFLPTHDKVG
jgi:hypothetical protein